MIIIRLSLATAGVEVEETVLVISPVRPDLLESVSTVVLALIVDILLRLTMRCSPVRRG